MSEIILDTITGKSTATTVTIGSTPVVSSSANSMTIRGEGSNQTSIQQGLTKCFWRYNISDNTFDDSLNVGSGTDNGTGLYTVTMTNNFGSATAMVGTSSGFTSSGGMRETDFVSYGTGSIQCTLTYQNGGGIDFDNSCCQILGGLA